MSHKLVVHIGLRKTGSSALQELLAKNTALLHAHDVDYPDRLTRFPAHQELAWCLLDPAPDYVPDDLTLDRVYDYYTGVIEANIEQGRTTLLSSEDLSLHLTMSYKAMEKFKARLGRFDPQIVFYARAPMSYLISNYKHGVYAGRETRSFSKFVFDIWTLLHANTKIIQMKWCEAFGKENVTVLRYDMALFQKRSQFASFLSDIFGAEIEDTFLSYRSNSGVPTPAVQYFLELNRSDMDDEALRAAKAAARGVSLVDSDDAFLKQMLTAEERKVLEALLTKA